MQVIYQTSQLHNKTEAIKLSYTDTRQFNCITVIHSVFSSLLFPPIHSPSHNPFASSATPPRRAQPTQCGWPFLLFVLCRLIHGWSIQPRDNSCCYESSLARVFVARQTLRRHAWRNDMYQAARALIPWSFTTGTSRPSSTMTERPRQLGDFKGWVNLWLDFRLKGYVSRQYLWTIR